MIEMEEVQIQLSALWVAVMLTYLLGDVMRIFSGDFVAGKIGGMQITQEMYTQNTDHPMFFNSKR
jgi:hypothetical protein